AGSNQAEYPVRPMPDGGPDLLTVHHVMVAIALGSGPKGGQIGSRPGLRIPLTPEVIQIQNTRKESLFLRGGTVLDQYRAHFLDTKWNHRRRFRHRALFQENIPLYDIPARAAILCRPIRSRPPTLIQDTRPTAI